MHCKAMRPTFGLLIRNVMPSALSARTLRRRWNRNHERKNDDNDDNDVYDDDDDEDDDITLLEPCHVGRYVSIVTQSVPSQSRLASRI